MVHRNTRYSSNIIYLCVVFFVTGVWLSKWVQRKPSKSYAFSFWGRGWRTDRGLVTLHSELAYEEQSQVVKFAGFIPIKKWGINLVYEYYREPCLTMCIGTCDWNLPRNDSWLWGFFSRARALSLSLSAITFNFFGRACYGDCCQSFNTKPVQFLINFNDHYTLLRLMLN